MYILFNLCTLSKYSWRTTCPGLYEALGSKFENQELSHFINVPKWNIFSDKNKYTI